MIHELKTWPQHFQAIKSGLKTFELRKNDKGFAVGDVLLLKEFDPKAFNHETEKWNGEYTGNEVEMVVKLIMEGELFKDFGLIPGFCIMAIDFKLGGWKEIAESNRRAYEDLCKSVQIKPSI